MLLSSQWLRFILVFCLALVLPSCDHAAQERNRYLESGKQLFKAGDLAEARSAFNKAAAIDPKDSKANLQLAEEIANVGDVQSAAQQYAEIIKLEPGQVAARIKLGQLFLLASNIPQAEQMAREALAREQENTEAMVLLGGALSAQDNTDAAFVNAEQALKLKPGDISATLLLASLKAKTGKLDEAISLLRENSEKNHTDVAPRRLLAELYQQKKDPDKAQEFLAEIVRLEPSNLLHRKRLAQFFVDNRKFDKAEEVLRDAVKEAPDDEPAKLMLVDYLAKRKSREAAIVELIPMLEQKAVNFELRLKLVDLQLAQQHYDDVEEILKESIELAKLKTQTVRARNKLAQFYLARNRIGDARKMVTAVLSEQGDNPDALTLTAELALLDGKIHDAVAVLRKLVADSPENVSALKLLAKAHLLNNDPVLALENLKKVLVAAPGDEPARIELVDLLLKTGHAVQAEQELDTLFKLNPDSKIGLEALSKIYLAQKKWELAKETAKHIQEKYASDALGYYLEGLAYQAEGRFEESIGPLAMAVQKQPQDTEALNQWVSAYLALKQHEKAIAKLNGFIKDHPNHYVAYNLLGGVYGHANKLQDAVEPYQKAIGLKPDWPKPYRNLAVIKRLQKKPEEAVALLNQGIEAVNDDGDLIDELAQIYHDRGEHDKVIGLYEKALRDRPETLSAINGLVGYIAEYGKSAKQHERAASLLPTLIESNNAILLDTAGWYLYRQEKFTQAKDILLKASSRDAENNLINYHLGMAFLKLGENAKAKVHLKDAINKNTEFAGLEEAKEAFASIKSN